MANKQKWFNKTTAPTANDDTTAGYELGDEWLDSTNDKVYKAIDVTATAAIWIEMVGRTQTQTLTNKTLTAPTIADFTNAQHGHSGASGGGVVTTATYPPGHKNGLTVSNNATDPTNDLDFTASSWRDSTNTVNMDGGAQTKRLDANWAPGTGNGMRNSAAAITNTTYHIYLVSKAAGADPDYYAHTSATVATVIAALQAESGGSAYLYARLIFSITRVSGVIRLFTNNGDEVLWMVPVFDVNNAATTSASRTLQGLSLPLGRKLDAILTVRAFWNSAGNYVLLTSPDQTDSVANVNLYDLVVGSSFLGAEMGFRLRTNTSAQIGVRSDSTTLTHSIFTKGYIDDRRV